MLGYGDVEYPVMGFVVYFTGYGLGTEGSLAAFDRYVGYELEPAYHFVRPVLGCAVLELHYRKRLFQNPVFFGFGFISAIIVPRMRAWLISLTVANGRL